MTITGEILALDLATTTGYACGKPGGRPKFGHLRFGKPDEPRGAAYKQFRLWLDLFCSAHAVELIVFESPAMPMAMQGRTNIKTLKLLMGFCENLEEWAYSHKMLLAEATVPAVRSHFIGQNLKRDIAKPLIMDRCKELGWDVNTQDEADACALWDYQCCFVRPDKALRTTPLFAGKN